MKMIPLDEYTVRNTILFLLWAEFIWETYLSIRQFNKAKSANEVPDALTSVMSTEEFQKAKDYSIAKLKYGLLKDTHSIILTSTVIYYGLLATAWDYSESINPVRGEVTTSCIWLFVLSLISTILDLPLNIYYTFILEEKYGFNKQTAGFYVWDKIKAFFVNQIIVGMISSVVIVIIKNGGPYFFVWLWAVVCVISMILLTIYPAVIAPLFDKYTPLPEGELRTQIEELALKLNFPLTQLYVVEGSKRSSHSNAYFYGLFKSKRIVLFDTLLAKDDGTGCKNDEILAVLSHELGHWSHGHIIKNLILVQVNLFLLFAGFSIMFKYSPLYKAVGFYNTQPALVGLFVVLQYVMMPYNTMLNFLMTCLSRKFEFQADNFAVNLGKAKPLEKALLQLNKDNLGFPINDDLYSAWHHSHPPLLERIAVLRESARKLN
ncbi:CAAX prenyl protease 1 homolog [Anoplophora glabripennis]|uniref:CAAX prenyl protease 1 homolog n=1 Tax=Anoplophora glabripennis TaxID=217634 RepID=UPI00087511BB|nr:CAAX prenyl protease 1 homolog [Anoplophora glabripennis]